MGSIEHNFASAGLFGGHANRRDEGAHRADLLHQAEVTRSLGSPFTAAVIAAASRQLHLAPRTSHLLHTWPGDPGAAALAMRLNGALHALARRGHSRLLSALYRGEHRDFDKAIGEALLHNDAFVSDWVRHPTQTNEVGRAAALLAALMVVARDHGMEFDLLELGSSCGLNLNLHRYVYELGDTQAGEVGSRVRLAPAWRGASPPLASVVLKRAVGVDLRPLDPADADTRERLLSFVWVDQPARVDRLEQALAIARVHPPAVERDHADVWLSRRLQASQSRGTCRAIMHSMVLQYLSASERQRVRDAILQAGARADEDRPLAWVGFEWDAKRSEVRLMLTTWPGGVTRQLASCHPYGDWIAWH